MKTKTLFLLSLSLFIGVYGDDDPKPKLNDPRLNDAIPLTKSGDHAFPIFSSDGSKIYFAAKGGDYGTSCYHVYQMDIRDASKFNESSLYSTGFGHEIRPVRYDSQKDLYSVVSNAFVSLKKDQPATSNLNDLFCPDTPDCLKGDDTKLACDFTHNIIHYKGETLVRLNGNGVFDSVMKPDSEDMWINQAATFADGKNVYSQSYIPTTGAKLAEQIAKNGTKKNGPIAATTGLWDGFSCVEDNAGGHKSKNEDSYFYFHGSTDVKGLQTIDEGVIISLGKTKVRTTTIKDNQYTSSKHILGLPFDDIKGKIDENYYVYPQPDPSGKIKALVTGIKPGVAKNAKDLALYYLEEGNVGIQVTDPTVNSFHGSIDPTGKYVVFVSDRDSGNQLYLGLLKSKGKAPFPPTYTAEAPKDSGERFGSWIKEAASYVFNVKQATSTSSTPLAPYNWPKLDGEKTLMYVSGEECPQIYQLNLERNDISVPKKMSSGIHAYESPNFLKNEDILFAATISRDYSSGVKCSVNVCANPASDDLKELCESVVVKKLLPRDSDLYISNKFGSLKERLTSTTDYTGEAIVAGDYLYYSSYDTDDYKIFKLQIYGLDSGSPKPKPEKFEKIGYGFEGDITVSPNGKLIAYYATRYTDDESEENKKYKQMHENQFTDISKTELYIYSIEHGVESKITNHGGQVLSPMFYDETSIVYVLISGDKRELHSAKLTINEHGDVSASEIQKVEMTVQIHGLSYDSTTKHLAFVDEANVYISKVFEPNSKEPPIKPDDGKVTTTTPKPVPTTLKKPIPKNTTPKKPTSVSTSTPDYDDDDFAYKSNPIILVILHLILLKLFI